MVPLRGVSAVCSEGVAYWLREGVSQVFSDWPPVRETFHGAEDAFVVGGPFSQPFGELTVPEAVRQALAVLAEAPPPPDPLSDLSPEPEAGD